MTPAELAAARAFRDSRRAALAGLDADVTVSVFIRNDRHDCAAKGGKSVFLELREHYAWSPAYHVCDCGEVCCPATAHLVECDNCGPAPLVPEKRFGWIWTQGKCPACGMTARSSAGRLVDPAIRPPSDHAIVT